MRRDYDGIDNGIVRIEMESTKIVVGNYYIMKIIYEASHSGICIGGSLRFKIPGIKADDIKSLELHCSNPRVILECTTFLPIVNKKDGKEFFVVDYLFVTIKGQPLRKGDTISFKYGHNITSKLMASFYTKKWVVEVATDTTGERAAPGSGFFLVANCPILEFVHDRPVKIDIIVPSTTVVEQEVKIFVRILDRYNNVVSDYSGKIKLFLSHNGNTMELGNYTYKKKDKGIHIFEDFVFDKSGINRVEVMDNSYGIYARSNPSKTNDACIENKVYWGETHTHSALSADEAIEALTPRPDGVYRYAREVSNLDFCMVTDHSEDLTEDDWKETQEAAAKHYEPEKFVTFSAYESTHYPMRKDGDKNIYHISDDIPFINKGSTTYSYEKFRKYEGSVMSIPHQHSLTNWSVHDPLVERVTEIYSHWGCGLSPDNEIKMMPHVIDIIKPQNYVRFALEQGIKIGFIASGDHSTGHPGDDFWWQHSTYNGGMAAVYSKSLTKEGVWESLWNRRCYATTRARILLEFEINGYIMGEEFSEYDSNKKERIINVNVYGTVSVQLINIIKNGSIWRTEKCKGGLLDVEFSFIDTKVERDTDYYYVHIVQSDGEQAWSSPIWIVSVA